MSELFVVQQSSKQLSLRMRYFSFDNASNVFICNVELKREQDPTVSVCWNVMRGTEMVECSEQHDLSLTLPVMLPSSLLLISSKLSFFVKIRGAAGLGMTGLGHGISIGQVTLLTIY